MKPKARLDAFTAREAGIALERLAAAVLRAADGTRTVAEIALHVSERLGRPIEEESIWSILDALADAKLLVGRVTPPAGATDLSRRSVLRTWGAAAAAFAVAPVVLPRVAQASLAGDKMQEQENKKLRAKLDSVKYKTELAAEQSKKSMRDADELTKSKEEIGKIKTTDDKSKEAEAKKTRGNTELETSKEELTKVLDSKASLSKASEENKKKERNALEQEQEQEELAKLKAPADKASEQKAKESRNKTLAQLAQQEQADLQKSMEADQKNNAAKLIEKAKEETAKEQVAKKVS